MNNAMFNGFNVTGSTFFDPIHYPYGFSRSGDFTIKQAGILNDLGRTLSALSEGLQQAVTAEEIQFVQVCAGIIPAETEVEKTWQRYRLLMNKPFVQVGSRLMAGKMSNSFLQSAY